MPEPFTEGPLAGAYRWSFRVAETVDLTPCVRRLRLTADDLVLLAPAPGQDLMLAVPVGDGATINRRYTIRSFDPAAERVDVDVVVHGDGPGAHWASTATVGDEIEGIGPRGKVVPNPDAPSHLFVGDAAGAPALLNMLESLPAGVDGHAVLAVRSDDERQPTTADEGRVTWLVGASDDDVDAAVRERAPDPGHVYLAGERGDVARQRELLTALGISSDAISPKAYWSRTGANAAHGEPAREG